MVPAFHLTGVLFDVSHQTLDAIGGLQTLSQLVEKSETMESEGVFKPLLKRARCFSIDLLQLGVEIGEPFFGGLIGRLLVSPLESGSPGFLVGLRQVTDDVLPLVPLAALDLSPVAEDLIDGLAQSLAAVDHAENALFEGKSPFN